MLKSGGATLETHMVRKDLFKTIRGLPLYRSPGHCVPNIDQYTLGAEAMTEKKGGGNTERLGGKKKHHFVQK